MQSGMKNDGLLVRFWIPNEDLLKTGTMFYPDKSVVVPELQKPIYLLAGDRSVRKVSVDDRGYKIEESDAIPMLGSMITDVKGKRIYQGDIVQVVGEPTVVEVVFSTGMFALLFQRDNMPFLWPLLKVLDGPGVAIIGNICDNPEITTLYRQEFHRV